MKANEDLMEVNIQHLIYALTVNWWIFVL